MTESERGAGEPLDLLLTGCRMALEAEIQAVRADLESRGLSSPLPGSGGRRVSPAGAPPVYEWTLPPGRYGIRIDDAVRVESERGRGLGMVVRHDRSRASIRVRMNEWLGPHPGPGLLTFDPTWILAALISRLREIDDDPERFHPETALRLLGREFPRVGRAEPPADLDPGLNDSQRAAISRILGSQAQLVWGPPGTGKTRLLGAAAAALAGEGRVLIVATTNVAVDEAASRVAACLGPAAIEANQVIRVGAEFSPTGDRRLSLAAAVERAERRQPSRLSRSLLELEGTLLDGRARARTPDLSLAERQARILGRARGDSDAVLMQRAGRLGGEMARAMRAGLDEARVVLSTFASLAIRDELADQRFNHLIVDEASAAPLPQVVHAACLADRSAFAFGDFQQLPPVVLSTAAQARRWLARDLFEESGVLGHGDGDGLPSPKDGLCSMLEEQYRMRPPIRALVSDLFYGGRLRDAATIGPTESAAPALILLESGNLDPQVSRVDGSRENEVHVEAILQLLEVLGREGVTDVGVVTPYRAQTRSLWRGVRGRLGQAAPVGLEISTIHRFQGREKAVVILDTVDAPPGSSWFLNERRNTDLPRLLNVALSRSRDLLILLGTTSGLQRTLPGEALLNRVMARVAENGVTIDASRPIDVAPIVRAARIGAIAPD
ncbi:MAG: DNA2/NAM7 family helicase [marine benthic group bacterium]|nr:DNA2/NAM7 family helicase [Gemmatimonadota bacterium]